MNTEVSRRWASTSKADIESRVITVCKAFDKITADKVILYTKYVNIRTHRWYLAQNGNNYVVVICFFFYLSDS